MLVIHIISTEDTNDFSGIYTGLDATILINPSTRIAREAIVDEQNTIVLIGQFMGYTEIPKNEIYVKVKGSAGEMRFALFDFADAVIDDIMCIVISDFGGYEWEGLYVDHEDDNEDLKTALLEQKRLIEEKYGECGIKNTINADLL